MKIRAVCYFITCSSLEEIRSEVQRAIPFFKDALDRLTKLGLPVQMVRFATNSFEEYVAASATRGEVLACMEALDALCGEVSAALSGVACIMSVGDAGSHVGLLPDILLKTDCLFLNMPLGLAARSGAEPLPASGPLSGSPDLGRAMECAKAVLALAKAGGAGDGLIARGPLTGMPLCFKCTVTARLEAGTPFFPGAMSLSTATSKSQEAWAAPGFAIATENSDLVALAFARVKAGSGLDDAREALREVMEQALAPLEALGQSLSAAYPGVAYVGIDPSIATAAAPEHSVVSTWVGLLDRLMGSSSSGRANVFGGPGTLAVSAAVTAALKSLQGVRTCGYAGLMLPQTEDDGLARAAARGELSLQGLLLNSAVCGTGLDTVVIPGDVEATELGLLYADVAAMAHRLGKPLACRVWPALAKTAGEAVSFRCPFFVDSTALPVRPADRGACPAKKQLGEKTGKVAAKRPAGRAASDRNGVARLARTVLKRPAAKPR